MATPVGSSTSVTPASTGLAALNPSESQILEAIYNQQLGNIKIMSGDDQYGYDVAAHAFIKHTPGGSGKLPVDTVLTRDQLPDDVSRAFDFLSGCLTYDYFSKRLVEINHNPTAAGHDFQLQLTQKVLASLSEYNLPRNQWDDRFASGVSVDYGDHSGVIVTLKTSAQGVGGSSTQVDSRTFLEQNFKPSENGIYQEVSEDEFREKFNCNREAQLRTTLWDGEGNNVGFTYGIDRSTYVETVYTDADGNQLPLVIGELLPEQVEAGNFDMALYALIGSQRVFMGYDSLDMGFNDDWDHPSFSMTRVIKDKNGKIMFDTLGGDCLMDTEGKCIGIPDDVDRFEVTNGAQCEDEQ